MPGTILLDDLRSSIGDELRSHAQGLLQLGQGAIQSINDAIPTPPPVPQGPDPNQILQELQQHAQQAAAAAQPALQVLGNAGQAASGAVTQLGQARDQVAQQLQDHVASLTQGAQDAVQSLATPPPPPAPAAPVTTPVLGAPATDQANQLSLDQTASDRVRGQSDVIASASAKTGVPSPVIAAIMDTEAGGPTSRSSQGANGFMQVLDQWFKPGEDPFDPLTNITRGAEILADNYKRYGSWDKAAAAYFGSIDAHGNITNASDAQGTTGNSYVSKFLTNLDKYGGAVGGALQAGAQTLGGAASSLGTAARGALDTASTAMNQSQFGDPQLTADEAYAACGPAAAVRFAERFGRNPTLREATDLAKQVGWTSGGGMAGITSEQRLLKNMGVDTHIVAPDWDAIAKEATTGNPVTISTPGHYFFADGYNPQTGAFHVGRSGLDLKNGSEWMTPTQMENLMGRAQGALFADNPAVPASSTSSTSLGGSTGASNAPITIGGPAPVKAPLYVKGALQDANGNVVADQGPTPIQSAADVLGGAAGAVGEAVGGAASALGSAAQGALAQATAPVQLQPGQVSARDQVNQVASDVQQAAQGVLGAAQDANRQTPGTTAVNAVAPVLGAAASDLGTAARGAVDTTVPVLGAAASDLGTQAEAFARSPIGQRLLQAAAENAQEGPSLIPAGTMSLYRDVMQVKNDWLEQNNPLNNLPGARPEPGHEGDITPGGLIAGLTTGIAQQFTDPLMLALLGPTSGLAEAGTGALSGAVSRIVGPQLAERLSPGAVSVLGTIAQKFSQGAIVGGLQNAMFEAEKKTSTPESVGQALVVGAGLGGVIDVGSVPVMAVVRRLGQVLLDRAPEISAALRSRQPAETNVNNALGGVPEMLARLRGEAAEPKTAPEPSTANPYDLPRSESEPSAAPLSSEEVLSHLEQLDQRHTQNDARIAELQNQISGGGAGDTPADRAELVRLQADQAQIDAAHTSIWDHAGSGGDVYARPASEAGVPLQGGLDAAAAQAAPISAPENAPSPGAVAETAASLPGAPGAAEPAARAESAQPELAGFRAPERSVVEPVARTESGQPEATGFRPPSSEAAPPIRQTVRGVEPGAPRDIGEVVTNPHLLNEARPGETPMTTEERLAHQDTLEQRYQANQDRLAAIDEQLRNPTQKPERPPWAAGYTNDNLVEIAQQHGQSAYEPLWWEKAGLDTGSGEVRLDVGQSGIRGTGTREPTPTELRAERNTLALDQRHIEATGEQQATAPEGARFTRRTERAADLPFAGGEENAPHGPYATEQASSGPGSLAEDIVTQNGRKSYGDPLSGDGLREASGEIVGTKGGITGTGISDINAEGARPGAPSAETLKRMPNLDAMLKGAMPEVRAQIQRAAEDNPELFDAYTQGRISHDSLVNDLATKVGMTREEWLKTPVGKGFNPQEMVALQAAAIDAQARSEKMARDIVARGGVDALSDEQVAYGLQELSKNTQLLTVARGGRSTAGRTLESLKNRLDATMARGINASNERIGAQRIADQAKRATARATQLLEKTREMDVEQKTAVATARSNGAPKNILDQIAAAYDQLDRYNAMTLHEKADDFNALKAAREAAAAKRQAAVREPPQELLSALQAELAAERKNFANRKNTWEDMAFWDSKANEIAAEKRNAFRGGLYIEQYRKSADLAAKSAEADAKRAFDLESKRQTLQSQRASSVLEAIGGAKPSRELLASYVKAITSDDEYAAGKFIKGLQSQGWWGRSQILRIAGLLSSTVTHMANMVGNISQVPLEVATHGMVVGIDWARAAATGGERQAYMAELGPMLEAYGPGFASSMPDALKILQTGISPDDLLNPKNMRAGLQSGSEKLDAAVEMPLRLLQAEDQVFKGGAFAMQANRVATRYAVREGFRGEQLKGRTANIVKNFEEYPELYKEAHDAMLRMVFQEHRDWIPSPRGAAGDVLRQPLPFIKTPANITAQGMGLSPFGLSSTIAAVRARGALQSAGGASQAQLGRATLLAEQRLARTALGTAIVGMGIGMGAGTFSGGKSMLTGAYDPNEASTYPQGWREWSVVTQDPVSGNTYYVPMQNFGAAGAPLAMAAILTDAGKRGHSLLDQDEAARAATSIGQYVLDNTFLQGLSDTVNVLHDPSRYANKFLESLVSSYGPYSAMGRQIQRAYGVASRNPHDGFMGLVEAMESNYPGFSGNVPESLTAIGEPRTQGISGAAAFALPVRADILRDEPTLKALRDNDVRIPPAPKAVNVGNGWSVDLTPEEQDQLQRARGVAIRDWVARMQAMPAYQNGDLGTRNLYLSKAVSNASQQADIDFYRSLSRADLQSTTAGGRAVRRTVPTPYTVAGEEPAA